MNGLSHRNIKLYWSKFRQSGLNGSSFFIKLQAMISILAASFTFIFVLIPFSFSLPRSLLDYMKRAAPGCDILHPTKYIHERGSSP